MGTPKFTAGPWDAIPHGNPSCWEIDNDEYCVAQGVWREADARLIAAGPDLYAACEAASEKYQELSDDMDADYAAFFTAMGREIGLVRAALAKARGEVTDGNV